MKFHTVKCLIKRLKLSVMSSDNHEHYRVKVFYKRKFRSCLGEKFVFQVFFKFPPKLLLFPQVYSNSFPLEAKELSTAFTRHYET